MPSSPGGLMPAAPLKIENLNGNSPISDAPNNDFYAAFEDAVKIMEPGSFSPEVELFLADEKICLTKLFHVEQYDCIIEVGCHSGRNAGWLSSLCHRYIGIDINESAIRSAKNAHASNARIEFVCGPVEHVISSILDENLCKRRIVVLFPFNLFGNFVNVDELISSFSLTGADLAMSNFNTRSATTLGRYNYYSNCFPRSQIRVYDAEQGVLFKAGNHFRSIAYDANYLRKLIRDRSNYHGVVMPFSTHGDLFLLTC